jgi:hypothetical protein
MKGGLNMKTTSSLALVAILLFGWVVAFAYFDQVPPQTEPKDSIKVIKVGETTVQVPTTTIQKAKVTKPAAGSDIVTSLVHYYRLDQKSKVNPGLAFGPDENRYWKQTNSDPETLRLQFAARRIILDAADRQNVVIGDQDMLSRAARTVVSYLKDSSTPTPSTATMPKEGQSVDVPCVICGCEGGDTSQDLIKKAWDALNANKGGMDPKKFEKALACAKVTVGKFAGDADEQQAARLQTGECKKTPTKEERDAYFSSNWALSDVAAAWFIRGQVLAQQRNCKEAKETYQTIIAKYNCAYIWDPRGWFWNAAKGANQELQSLENNGCTGRTQ